MFPGIFDFPELLISGIELSIEVDSDYITSPAITFEVVTIGEFSLPVQYLTFIEYVLYFAGNLSQLVLSLSWPIKFESHINEVENLFA